MDSSDLGRKVPPLLFDPAQEDRMKAAGRWKLYWVSTADETEDWFVVAKQARTAARFHERYHGFERGEAQALLVADVPVAAALDGLHYAGEDVLRACGAEVLRVEVPRAVRFDGEVFVEGPLQHIIDQKMDDCFEACGRGRPNLTTRRSLPS